MFKKLKTTRSLTTFLVLAALTYLLILWAGSIFKQEVINPAISQLEEWQPQSDMRNLDPPPYYNFIEPSKGFEFLWEVHPVFTNYRRDSQEIHLTTTANQALFLGSLDNSVNRAFSLMGFDLQTGQILWHKTDEPFIQEHLAVTIESNEDLIYVGFDGVTIPHSDEVKDPGKIIAYDTSTGQRVWTQELSNVLYVNGLNISNQSIGVSTSGSGKNYILNAKTGEFILEGNDVLWFVQNNILYDGQGLVTFRAKDRLTGTILWESVTYPIHKPAMLVSGMILVSTPQSVLALDSKTGNELWEYQSVVSNIATNDAIVFLLTKEFSLVALDINTGELISQLAFHTANNYFTGNSLYFVNRAFFVTASNDVVVIYFGDSHQLMAFRFSPDGSGN